VLVYAALLITGGRLGDIYGPRNLFVAGLAVFTAASAFCGLAQDPSQLIAARALQGVGGALMAPQILAVITGLFPPGRRGVAFAMPGAVGGLAVAVGPTLGGFLVTNFGWPWIFHANLPVGVAAIALALLVVPDLRPDRRRRLDVVGVLLVTAGLFGITFGLIEGERYDWGTVFSFVTIPGIIIAGVVFMLIFLLNQYLRQDKEPLLPFSIFRNRNYSLMALVVAAVNFAILGLFLPLTIYFQSALGLSALEAGFILLPQALISMLIAGPAGGLADRFGGKYILMGGLALFAAGMGYVDWIAEADSGRWSFLPGLIVAGVGMGLTWAPLYNVAMRDVLPQVAGVASGVFNTIQEMGAVFASAVVGALLQNRLAVALRDEAAQRAEGLPEQFREPFVDGFSNASEGGIEVGTGQTGAGAQLPRRIQQLGEEVFENGFVDAMHPTLVLPIAIVLLAAINCFAVRQGQGATGAHEASRRGRIRQRWSGAGLWMTRD